VYPLVSVLLSFSARTNPPPAETFGFDDLPNRWHEVGWIEARSGWVPNTRGRSYV
jgi:hypothetical protein